MRIINVLLDLVLFFVFFCYDWAGLCKVEREERKEKQEKIHHEISLGIQE